MIHDSDREVSSSNLGQDADCFNYTPEDGNIHIYRCLKAYILN
jgi:hypothetical protein